MGLHLVSFIGGFALGIAVGMRLYQWMVARVIRRMPECKKDLYKYELIRSHEHTIHSGDY